jgi:hypothetical protein
VHVTPATEPSAWDTPAATDAPAWDAKPASSGEDSWSAPTPVAQAATKATKAASSIIPDGVKKSWASMFAPAPAPKKAPEPVEKYTFSPIKSLHFSNISSRPVEATKPAAPAEAPPVKPEAPISDPVPIETEEPTPVEITTVDEPEIDITPSKDELTETNLEQVPDVSHPVPTATAASTAASSWDPRNVSSGSPYSALQNNQPQATRPPATSGFQASALKATGTSGRATSFQRRVLDQEEAVRMPGNRDVNSAAVQFGAFNLNGSGDDDVDGDREEPETRAQPPQHSPVAPRATLPPSLQQPPTAPENYPTQQQTTSLPHPTSAPGLPSPQTLPGTQNTQQGPQGNGQFGQYGRFGQTGTQESSLPPKPFDAFSQQAPSSQSPFEGYPNQQAQSQSQPQPQSGAFSSASTDYPSYYTASHQRNAYDSYYQGQGQYGAQGPQDGAAPQRPYSGYVGPQTEGASAPFHNSAAQQPQSRLNLTGEGPASGHSTPNPATQNQPQTAAQGGPQPGHPQQPQATNYPNGHPYYTSPYYAQYMNNNYQYGAANYAGGPYGAKGGAYGQAYPGYGMSPGAPYEHASSPAAGGFGASALHGRDSALGGLADYGRAGSAQSSQAPQSLGSGAFSAGAHDAFSRGASYQTQTPQHYSGSQGNQPGSADDLKPYGETKAANGPSPSLTQAGRPGSATNPAPGIHPPPQSQQAGYGGYPAHLQQGQHGLHGSQAGSQYGGLGAAGGHQGAGQGHQNSPYGGYQAFGGQGSYYGSGQQQQRGGGWGGAYGGH